MRSARTGLLPFSSFNLSDFPRCFAPRNSSGLSVSFESSSKTMLWKAKNFSSTRLPKINQSSQKQCRGRRKLCVHMTIQSTSNKLFGQSLTLSLIRSFEKQLLNFSQFEETKNNERNITRCSRIEEQFSKDHTSLSFLS